MMVIIATNMTIMKMMMMKKKKKAWPFMPISDQSERFRARRLRPPRPRILLPCEDDFDDLDNDEKGIHPKYLRNEYL